jgi:hypothetical protein
MEKAKLRIGDYSDNGQITIVDDDKLCYLVRSTSRGASGLRTISKALLKEFVDYVEAHPDASPRDCRDALSGESGIDKYEYGYDSTLLMMAKMVLGMVPTLHHSQTYKIIRNDNLSSFVWECIKLFNKRNEIEELFTSSWRKDVTKTSKYITLNGCYVARKGETETEAPNVETVTIYDNTKITNQFYVSDIEPFVQVINTLFADRYKIISEKIDGKDFYSLLQIGSRLVNSSYLPYLTALRTKPFMLLAGISGTGKSRIVREMAKACWTPEDDEYSKNCPRNFCMVQVKPNWHDSSDLIGYVSRINGEKYVVGPFLRFIAKAIKDPKRPYFLCLDEMNLAPVEQYFAEYLSVIESRKLQDGQIETDPIVPYENTEAYGSLIDQLFDSDEERKAYKTEEGGKRLTVPENLFVVGTVNMDETTFSFSRKVLDRAMTIEMNKVDLKGGLEAGGSAEFGYIGEDLMGDAAEGKDIYADNQALCDDIITYLGKVNEILEGTPFKIAYRTRNEFLLYAVNRLHFATDSELWQTLDEMTSMKILSRIEGDNERCERVLREMKQLLTETVGEHAQDSVSLKKIDEMTLKLKSGYTSYWA